MELCFPTGVIEIINDLENAGYNAYIVGGAVRNCLLGISFKDFDITTEAKVEQIKKIFADCKIIETGIKHGTVTVIKNGVSYEITTFRRDGDYKDMRHPDSVEFLSSLEEDLKRRDFTVNAMAYSPKSGLVDLFGGADDAKTGIIRCVGEPEKRFNEDGLRILRAVRFSSELGFEIEQRTFDAMIKCKDNLDKISVERIFTELTKTLCGEYAEIALRKNHEILFKVIPELAAEYKFDQNSPAHDFDVFEHTLKAIAFSRVKLPIVMWALILHDIGKPHCYVLGSDGYGHCPGHMELSSKIADKILKRFKVSNEFKHRVSTVVKFHDASFKKGKFAVKKFISEYDKKMFYYLLEVKRADCLAHSKYGIDKYYPEVLLIERAFKEINKKDECCSLSSLAVDGNDILSIGAENKRVGSLLKIALNAVMEEKVPNEKQKILLFLKNYV